MFVIKLLLKVLKVDDQAFISPLRLAFLLHRCLGDATWDSIVASIRRRGICMHFVNTWQRVCFYGFCCLNPIAHALSFALVHPRAVATQFTSRKACLI